MNQNMINYTKRANFAIIIFAWVVTFMAFVANVVSDAPATKNIIAIGFASLLALIPTILYVLNGPILLTKWITIGSITIYCYYNLIASVDYGSFRALFLFFEALILVALYLNELVVIFYAISIEIVNIILYAYGYEIFFDPVDFTSIFHYHVAYVGCTILLCFITSWGKELLKKSEERWQFALEGSGDGVWDWNIQSGEVFFSKQWKNMLGFEDDEIGNHLDEWDSRLHPEDRERVYQEIDRHLKNESPFYQTEHRFKCKDGSYKWILDRGKVMIRSKDGKPLRMVCSHTDIDQQKKFEQVLREERDRAQALQIQLIQKEKVEALGHLTAGVAHEINSPLGVIRSNIQITELTANLLEERLELPIDLERISQIKTMIDKLRKINGVNVQACKRISEIVKELQKFSRVDEAVWQEFDLQDGIENVLTLIYNYEYNQRIKIHKNYQKIPKLYCDPAQINQVIMNIIHNRLQAIEGNGDIYLSTSADEKHVYFKIRDTGKGISREQQSRIFNPGFKIGDVVEMDLGLMISYNIVQNHHGDIRFVSDEEKGSEFTIYLPAYNLIKQALIQGN